jgi:hypothetical protein
MMHKFYVAAIVICSTLIAFCAGVVQAQQLQPGQVWGNPGSQPGFPQGMLVGNSSMNPGAAAANIGSLGGALGGTLPNPTCTAGTQTAVGCIKANRYVDLSMPPYSTVPDNFTDWSATIDTALATGAQVVYFPLGATIGQYIYCVPEGIHLNNTSEFQFGSPSITLSSCSVSFTGSISGTTLTVSSILYGSGHIAPNNTVNGSGITAGTHIVSQLTGTTGSTGTYQVNNSQTVSSETMSIGLTQPTETIGPSNAQISRVIIHEHIINGGGVGATAAAMLVQNVVNSEFFMPQAQGGFYALELFQATDDIFYYPLITEPYGPGAVYSLASGAIRWIAPKIDTVFPAGAPTNSYGTSGWSAWQQNHSYLLGNVASCNDAYGHAWYIQVITAGTSGSGSCPAITTYFAPLNDGTVVWNMMAEAAMVDETWDQGCCMYEIFGDHTAPSIFGTYITSTGGGGGGQPQNNIIIGSVYGSNYSGGILANSGQILQINSNIIENLLATNAIGIAFGAQGAGTCVGNTAWCGDAEMTNNFIESATTGIANNSGVHNDAFGNHIYAATTAMSSATNIGDFTWTGNSIGVSNTASMSVGGGTSDHIVINSNNCNGAGSGLTNGSSGAHNLIVSNGGTAC